MTSKSKCPFCQTELEDAGIHSAELYFWCPNCYMKQKEKDDNYTASPRIWQALIESHKSLVLSEQSADREIHRLRDLLSQSQKDLEIARKVLEKIISDYEVGASSGWLAANAKQALEQIDHIAGASKMVEPKE